MARRFEFRFETLLRMREQREQEHKRIVAARLREIAKLEDRRQKLMQQIHEQTEVTRKSLRGDSPDVDELKHGRHWLLRLRRGEMETEDAIRAQKLLLDQERRQLAEAAKQTKVLARLKEKQLAEYRAEENRREQSELDEMNVLRHARSVMTGEGGSL